MVLHVNQHDQALGVVDKWQAHKEGLLHRAFSILIFNQQGDFLLQRRADTKYHSGGLWSNSCCGHPVNPSDVLEQAAQRLEEEMGFRTLLQPAFCFHYCTEVGEGIVENEIDHVFTGQHEGLIPFNAQEVSAIRWVSAMALAEEIRLEPANFTSWFHLLHQQFEEGQFSGIRNL